MNRLDQIKNSIIGLKDNEGYFADIVQLDVDDYAYLFEQAEKAERYEEVLKNIALLGDYYSQTMAKNVLNGTLEVVKEKDLETKRCEPCGGSGILGFQRETCWFCGGKGGVMK